MTRFHAILSRIWPGFAVPSETSGTSGYLPALEGVRGLALVVVLFAGLPASGQPALDGVIGFAALGYDLFFILSGYLLTRLLMFEQRRRGRIVLRDFVLRRGLRILPIYGLVCIAISILVLWDAGLSGIPESLAHIFLVENFRAAITGSAPHSAFGEIWMIPALFQLYLIIPILAGIAVANRRLFVFLALAWLGLSAVFTCILVLEGVAIDQVRYFTLLRPEALLAGVALAIFEPELWRWRSKAITCVGAFFLALAVLLWPILMPTGSLAEWAGVYAGPVFWTVLIIPVLISRRLTLALSWAPLAWFGRMSLTVFLLHAPILFVIQPIFENAFDLGGLMEWTIISTASIGLSTGLATVIWYGFERKVLRLKRQFDYIEGRPLIL